MLEGGRSLRGAGSSSPTSSSWDRRSTTTTTTTTSTRLHSWAQSQRRVLSSSVAAEEESYDFAQGDEEEAERMAEEGLVFVHNNKRVPFPYQSTQDFLLLGKRGAYTTARSVDRKAVFEFEAHVERLVKTTKLMLEAEGRTQEFISSHDDLLSYDKLRPKIVDSISCGMKAFAAQNGDQEMKIIVLMTWESDGFDIYTLIVPLGERPSQPVKVQIGGKPRENALAKDSEWIRQRRELELARPEDCNEVILVDDAGRLFEGLQTNFYVLKDNRIQTAGHGILEGTVRKLLLEECEKENIGVCLDPPNMADLETWQGVFISSTSRLLLPVSEIIYTEGGVEKKKSFAPLDPLVVDLERLILDRYREESTSLV